jgi:hypothetical protein
MMRSNRISLMLVAASSLLVASCGEDNPIADAAGEACGLECGTLAEGSASISGVASVDAFFSSVISFQGKANGVSAAIEAELSAIRADFGIAADADLAAGLQAQIDANVSGGISIVAEPARCTVDASATLEAQAKCDASIDPGMASVQCMGSCEVEASANVDCGADVEVQCTFTQPSAMCTGTCSGTCEVEVNGEAACDGTCTGTCSGECSAYSDSAGTQCAGKCDGMCTGSCKAVLEASATCEGECEGECTTTAPDGNCEGAVRAECKGEANAMVECKGKCSGEFEPPMAKAECQASAKAEAKMNVECSPPRLEIAYVLNAEASANVEARARFVAGMENLKFRLPRLMAAFAKAELIVEAGAGLAADASGAVKGGVDAAGEAIDDGNLKLVFGINCALAELPKVGTVLGSATSRLEGNVSAVASLKGALGM